jgi:hypothetical protein
MKKTPLLLAAAALLLLPLAALAQIDFYWSLPNPRVPLYAPIPAIVRVTNPTGRDFDLGPRGNAVLSFEAEDSAHHRLEPPARPRPLFTVPVVISNGATVTLTVNAAHALGITQADSYMLAPVITVGGETAYTGKRLALEVQPGLDILSRDFGSGSPTPRRASLRLIHRDQSDIVFFRLDDPLNYLCFGVYELGSIIRYFTPQVDLDSSNVFHVLFQNTPDRFNHATFSYDGTPIATDVYIARVGAIGMVRDASGNVAIRGGIRFTPDPDNPGYLSAPSLPPSTPTVSFGPEGSPAPPAPISAPGKKHFWQR